MTLRSVVMFMRVYLASIDFEDYRLSHRFEFLCHRFTWRPLRPRLGLGTVEPQPPPPSQVDRCHPVPVHYDSTVSAPELTSQSLVRLESLPASRTSHTRTSCVSFAQTDNRKTEPSGLILDLSLSLSEPPTVHSTPIPSTLTIPLPVETPYALNILQNYRCSLFNRHPDNPLRHVMKEMTDHVGSPRSMF